MLMVQFRSLVLVVLGASSALACAAPASEESDEVMVDDAELRGLKTGELAGTIACGETKRVHHSGSPTYRALAIAAKKGQVLDVRVAAPGHDARAWLTTASNATKAVNDDAAAGTKDARIVYTAKSTTTHHVVFREKNFEENVDFDVTLACPGANDGGTPPPAPATDDPFDPASCDGPQMTQAQAIAKIGAGSAFNVVTPAKKLMQRKRSCNPVTGCGAWSAPEPASLIFYMSSGGDNFNVPRQFDVHFALRVQGNDIEAVVEDVSNHAHCPGCGPSGITYSLSTSSIRGSYATLYVYYPRLTHMSSGFQVVDTWASVPLGPTTTATMKVTDKCARASVLSEDGQTEYAVLYRY